LANTERVHALDALRAFALLSGVLLHSTLSYVLPGGAWAVGTTHPAAFPTWLVAYLHAFRLETFFLFAGFFGALVVANRGMGIYLRDRAKRIVLVFIVAIYPMKLLLTALWFAGGRETGWFRVPPQIASRSSIELAGWSVFHESWHGFILTHLWFLYYLGWITGLFVALRWLALRLVTSASVRSAANRLLYRLMASPVGALVLALAILPALALGAPELMYKSLSPKIPTLVHYGLFFGLGWWLYRNADLLRIFARHCIPLLLLGLGASIIVIWVRYRYAGTPWVQDTELRLFILFASSLTTAASVLGWLGCFVRYVARPSPAVRYVADGSYWIYVMHLPIVVALQVWWAGLLLPWWIQVPLINIITLGLLLFIYSWAVRPTWVGAWLNGKRLPPGRLRAEQVRTTTAESARAARASAGS